MLVPIVNSIPRCSAISNANKVLAMGRPRKKLDKWQRDDAERLKRLFEQSDQSQEAFALQNDLGTQGNVWQYLNGHIPLNLDAALKFAAGLGVTVAAFSPTLAARLAAPIMADHRVRYGSRRASWH